VLKINVADPKALVDDQVSQSKLGPATEKPKPHDHAAACTASPAYQCYCPQPEKKSTDLRQTAAKTLHCGLIPRIRTV